MSNKEDKTKRDKRSGTQNEESGGSDEQPESSPEQRRKALRRILAGGGIVIGAESLPSKWTRPVIDSVILPAHAATSLVDPCQLSFTVIPGGVQVDVTGSVKPPTEGVVVEILVELRSGAVVVDSDTTTATTNANGVYTASTVTLSGSGTNVRATTSIDGATEAMCEEPLPAPTTTTSTTMTTTQTTFTSTTTSFFPEV